MSQNKAQKNVLFNSLLFLTILCLPFYLVRFSVGPIPTTLLEVLIYIIFLVALLSKKIKVSLRQLYLPIIFVLFGLVAVFIDPQVQRAAGLWKAYFFDGLLVYIIVLSLDKKEKGKVFMALATSGALTALVAIAMFFMGVKSQDGRLLDLDRLSPNYLSMFLIPSFIASLFMLIKFVKEKATRWVLYFSLCSLIMVFALVLAGSRGSYLALPIALFMIAYPFIKPGYQRLYKYIATVGSICVLLASFLFFRPVFGDMGRTGSSSNIRYYIWTTSLEIVDKNPIFGVGLGNFQDYFTNLTRDRVNYGAYIAPQALTAHNLYLHLYLTTGLLGLVSFVALTGASILRSKNVPVVALLVAILVYGLVDTPFFRNDLSAMFWILLALL